jgi:hypothetical protein
VLYLDAMAPLPLLLTLTALLSLSPIPASAKVVAEGKPSKGYFWQKVQKANGQSTLMCRSTSSSTIQKAALCEKAGAKQP